MLGDKNATYQCSKIISTLLLCKSSIWFTEKHIFKIIIYFFNTSKCVANYVISFGVYDGFISQKYLKLWRQESWPFGPGWAAHITSIGSWTFRLPCSHWIRRVEKRTLMRTPLEFFSNKLRMNLGYSPPIIVITDNNFLPLSN